MSPKIALLIDAENMSYRDMPHILDEVSRQGEIVLQAIYGDWEKPHLQMWHDIATEHNLKIRHQTNDANAKNAADMKLIMDAMDILHHIQVDIFCLVSNDVDYVPLCDKIRESHKYVIGVGYSRASGALIRACNQFIFLHQNEETQEPPIQTPSEQTDQLVLQILLSKAFATLPQSLGKWVTLSKLGIALRNVQPDFNTRQYRFPNLSKLLQSLPDFIELQTQDNVVALAKLKDDSMAKRYKMNTVQNIIIQTFAYASQDSKGWVSLSELGSALREVQPNFKTNHYGHANLSKLLTNMPDFIELQKQGNVITFAKLKDNSVPKQYKGNAVKNLIIQAFVRTPKDAKGWVALSVLGTALRQVQADFKTNHYGHANLSKLLTSMPDFVELRTQNGTMYTRLKK